MEGLLIIKVVDSIMGSGKTQSAINLMNRDTDKRYIYITPFLDEVRRITDGTERKFFYPRVHQKKGRTVYKHEHFHELLKDGCNIVSTHSLFSRANEETMELIYSNDYVLILDEVMDVVEQIQLNKDDLNALLDLGFIDISEDTGLISWNEEHLDKDTEYNHIKDMALKNSLYVYNDQVFIWTFPAEIFNSFQDVYILTYLFDAQIQKYYYDLNNLEYEYYYAQLSDFNMYEFVKGTNNEEEIKGRLRQLIHVWGENEDDKLNRIGDKDYSLSYSWYGKRDDSLSLLKNNVENFFKNKMKAKSNDTLWTTFKRFQPDIKGRGYSKSWTPINLRATNKYSDRHNLAYTVNRYLQPIIKGFFINHGVKVNEDQYALSELIQWVFRSGIRNDEEIYIYIPSKRMRNLFINWLRG